MDQGNEQWLPFIEEPDWEALERDRERRALRGKDPASSSVSPCFDLGSNIVDDSGPSVAHSEHVVRHSSSSVQDLGVSAGSETHFLSTGSSSASDSVMDPYFMTFSPEPMMGLMGCQSAMRSFTDTDYSVPPWVSQVMSDGRDRRRVGLERGQGLPDLDVVLEKPPELLVEIQKRQQDEAQALPELGLVLEKRTQEQALAIDEASPVQGVDKMQLKLSKRTKLVAFAARRRHRHIEAFEMQIREYRREIEEKQKEEERERIIIPPRAADDDDTYIGEPRMDLTDDLLHKVFSYLDDTSLCTAAIVCRQWRVASSHEDFWKVLKFEGRKVTPKQVRSLCYRYPRAIELNLRCKMIEDVPALEAIRTLRNLQVLKLGEGVYGDNFFQTLATECEQLRILSIIDAFLGNGGTQEIQIRHDSLLNLDILKCRVLRVYIRCARLEELSLSKTGTAGAMLHCPQLTKLDVSSCHKLSDTGVRSAATACPQLLDLDISHCSYVSDETLREIARACSNLRSLDASHCPNISLEGVRMSMLVKMTLCNCEGINTQSMTALADCEMLEELLLDYCWLLSSVLLSLPRLHTISLTYCRKFTDLTLRAPRLNSINVSSCQALLRVDLTSTNLKRLAFTQQQGLSVLALDCPQLHEVDLTECDSLPNSICEVFSRCPRLTNLTLDNCEGLTGIRLNSTSLIKLSLVGCRKVYSIELACPNLQSLQLDGCDHLSYAVLKPVGLRSLNLGICPHLTRLIVNADEMTSLDLRGCGILRQAEIRCPKLLSLDASYCSQLGDDCLEATSNSCPLIQSLVLASCPSVGANGLLALKRLSGLTVLDLSYTFLTDLSPIYDACPQLEVLRLSACKYLANEALVPLHGAKYLPKLQELDLSYGSLGRAAIEDLLSECPHLKHVSLNGCVNVYDIDWPVEAEDVCMEFDQDLQPMDVSTDRMLQILNCVGCSNIKRVIIPHNAGCYNLSSLNLSLSTNIKEVCLACSNLVSLNLSNCVALMELKLDCPRLMSLCLQASGIEENVLEEAIRDCSVLETLDLRNCSKIPHSALVRIRGMRPGIKRLYNSLTI